MSGRAIGSVQIDEIFQREVERRLSFILHAEDNDSEYIAEDIVNLTLAGQTRGRSNNRLEWGNLAGKDMIKREAEEMTKSRRKTSFQREQSERAMAQPTTPPPTMTTLACSMISRNEPSNQEPARRSKSRGSHNISRSTIDIRRRGLQPG